MNAFSQENFELLCDEYLTDTGVSGAMLLTERVLMERSEVNLKWLLRDHKEVSIDEDTEIELRFWYDEMMGFFSMLELALLFGFVDRSSIPDRLASRFSTVLSQEDVQCYYTKHYPLALPQLLLFRLREQNATWHSVFDVPQLFLQFQILDSRFRMNHLESKLLAMFDDFVEGEDDFSIDDFFDALESPGTIAKKLKRSKKGRKLGDTLIEFGAFVAFLIEFRQLLKIAEEISPIAASALWHHYAYWFDIVGANLKKNMLKSVAKIAIHHTGEEDCAGEAIQSIKELTSKKYAKPVLNELKQLKADKKSSK